MRVKNILGALGISALAPFAVAENFSYTYVEAGYSMLEAEAGNSNVDADGLGLGISVAVNEMVYIVGGYSTLEFDDTEIEQDVLSAGVGAHTLLSENTDLFGELMYLNSEVDAPFFGSEDDTGYGLTVGIRHALNTTFELEGSINYVDIFEETDTGFTFGGRAYLAPAISLGLAYTSSDDIDGFVGSFRFDF